MKVTVDYGKHKKEIKFKSHEVIKIEIGGHWYEIVNERDKLRIRGMRPLHIQPEVSNVIFLTQKDFGE